MMDNRKVWRINGLVRVLSLIWLTSSMLVLGSAAGGLPIAKASVAPREAHVGAALPFTEYEAEEGRTSGTLLGPNRTFTTIEAEASGRRAVRLDRRGQGVTFVLRTAANAVTLRAALPDGSDGRGLDATLSVFANGKRLGAIALTSRYGWFYGDYPFTNRPGDGRAHHMFDEARLRFGRALAAGTRVRFAIDQGDMAPWYVLDVADFEFVPAPRQMPQGALSVSTFGADPTGARSSAEAFEAGISAASRAHRPLWIPPGTYTVERHLIVDRVRILGAGIWYSTIKGDGVGFYGKSAPHGSSNVELGHFAILGEVVNRVDTAQRNAIGGAMGGGSWIHDLFIQHHKVGLWFDGPMSGIRISRLRVLDCTADGLNFHRGVSNAVVENSFWRNTGDDALAAWSQHHADHHLVLRHNTIVAPILANGIAIYGGHDITVDHNLIADTVTEGGGLHLGNRFNAVHVSGRISFDDNVVVRGGSFDPRWRFGIGAIWFYALDAPISADVRVRRTALLDSSEAAVQFLGKPIRGVSLDHLRIKQARGAAVQIQASGAATIRESWIGRTGATVQRECGRRFALKVYRTRGLSPEPSACQTFHRQGS